MRVGLFAAAAMGAALMSGAAFAAAAPKSAPAKPAARTPSCNRDCLVGVMQHYLDSLVAHSAKGLPLAKGVKVTEQAARIPVGDGLWVSASDSPTTFKIFVADPTTGQVGFFGVMKQWGKPILLASRLKLAGGKITEIENVVAADLRETSMANLQSPR